MKYIEKCFRCNGDIKFQQLISGSFYYCALCYECIPQHNQHKYVLGLLLDTVKPTEDNQKLLDYLKEYLKQNENDY